MEGFLGYFKAPFMDVSKGAQIGDGTKIWRFTHIDSNAVIGNNCTIGQGCYVNGVIGDRCKIQNHVSVFSGVEIGNDVFIGPGVIFTNVSRPRAFLKAITFTPTIVETGVTIGAGAAIVCGITIGEYAFVGAGAVVTNNVSPHVLMVGNPARIMGYVCKCGAALENGGSPYELCINCGQ